MPALETGLADRVSEAIRLCEIAEVARITAPRRSQTRKDLVPARLEYIYEIAYLRIFVGWEVFLEQAFLRYLCGYVAPAGAVAPALGQSLHPTLASAEAAMLQGQAYLLWHNPSRVVQRLQRFFKSNPMEPVVQSNLSALRDYGAIRHRITHGQSDARVKFDGATMNLAGKRYRGSRAGAFLRDMDRASMPPVRWIEKLGNEMRSLAAQMV